MSHSGFFFVFVSFFSNLVFCLDLCHGKISLVPWLFPVSRTDTLASFLFLWTGFANVGADQIYSETLC